ncbi:MAG: ornithine carbamoyltransferase, partial [Alphaproteobacteria bacterium]|nr:ornithine carbamoyltransferase [Alphaproteobacteria bacterium]
MTSPSTTAPGVTAPRHFLDLDLLQTDELRRILDMGHGYKHPAAKPRAAAKHHPLAGKTLAMV